jgi:hypothetical protein
MYLFFQKQFESYIEQFLFNIKIKIYWVNLNYMQELWG